MSKAQLKPNDLEIGHFVVLPMGWVDHPFMRNQFVISTPEQLKILKHLKVSSIDVDLKRSTLKKPKVDNTETAKVSTKKSEPSPEELWQQKQRSNMRDLEQDLELQEELFKLAVTQLAMSPTESLQSFKNILGPALEKVYDQEGPLVLSAIVAERESEDVFAHSLNCLHLGLVLAKQIKLSRQHAEVFGLACLCHDLGMLKIPQNIKRTTQELTKQEQSHYRTHPTYSQEMLRKAAVFPKAILPLSANHQEFLDGSGFPKGLKQDKISQLTQLLSVVVYFDQWVNPLPSQRAFTAQQALARVFKLGGKKLNQNYSKALLQTLGVYPPGSFVKLDDDRIAMVVSTNPSALMQPLTQILESGKSLAMAPFVDLQAEGLKIKESFAKEELPSTLQTRLPALPRAILQLQINE
ncbi:HD-GYP domain-containing protein [Alginatibacterium sediminis]|uniref:HD-GYP domain-containing protein n=1 Tax=Alginatibacterium sediminis TaxID=2164068 RepID=A0A420EAY8_9ALTE|nr:HD-GYP domain-containing protein [Alginatibacterium sediminis]RKF17841.1 HD-GYP domain-containing protein [Alginatibacterium sediminis]